MFWKLYHSITFIGKEDHKTNLTTEMDEIFSVAKNSGPTFETFIHKYRKLKRATDLMKGLVNINLFSDKENVMNQCPEISQNAFSWTVSYVCKAWTDAIKIESHLVQAIWDNILSFFLTKSCNMWRKI